MVRKNSMQEFGLQKPTRHLITPLGPYLIVISVISLLYFPSAYATSFAQIHLDPIGAELREGYNVIFSGILTSSVTPIPNRTIFIEDQTSYVRPDIILAVTTTDSDGKFVVHWKAVPKDNGNPFHFVALFLGGKMYGYTSSENYESTIESSNKSSTEVIPPTTTPSWFKEASELWHDGKIRDIDYSHGIMNMINYGIIKTNDTSDSFSDIPSWVRNDAKWYADGNISNDQYIRSLEYLVNNKIIE